MKSKSRQFKSLRLRVIYNALFRYLGFVMSMVGLVFIVLLISSLLVNGHRAFYQSYIVAELSPATLDAVSLPNHRAEEVILSIQTDLRHSILKATNRTGSERSSQQEAIALISANAVFYVYKKLIKRDVDLTGKRFWVPSSSDVDQYLKDGKPENFENYSLNSSQVKLIEALRQKEVLQSRFSSIFLTANDSRTPELSGIFAAFLGSIYTFLVTLLIAVPLGVALAIYLQEFAKRNRLIEFIEINVNNLAAVPSIIFGLLGLAIFINMLGMPRAVPLVGGMVLALMTFPIIVIASRQALLAVPTNIREGALSLGATHHQMVFHHVIPYAAPSIMTGAIIGMARALGETAPLLMLGMVAFIASAPEGVLSPATTLPVQIYLWVDSPERGMVERTIGAILLLILFLILMNGVSIYLRYRFESNRL